MSNLNKSKYTAEDEYPDLESHNNHTSHVLTLEMYKHLRAKQTPSGFTIDHVIQSGVDNSGDEYNMSVGAVAGDEASYEVFAEFFDPVIEARHGGYKPTDKHTTDLNASKISGGNFEDKYVSSCRIRTGRSVRGFAMPAWASRAERRGVESIVSGALSELSGEFSGKYYQVKSMSANEISQLNEGNFMFSKPADAAYARDWPDARGLWHNQARNFLVWVNNDDHTRIMSMQKGGNMSETVKRFFNGLKEFGDAVTAGGNEFQWSEHLGFILSCPSNLGTGVRCSVHAKLPKLSSHSRFNELLAKSRLSMKSFGEDGLDISNSDRIGYSEIQLIQMVIDGVNLCIKLEKMLESGEKIDGEVDKLQQK